VALTCNQTCLLNDASKSLWQSTMRLILIVLLFFVGNVQANDSHDRWKSIRGEYIQAVSKRDHFYQSGLSVKASVVYRQGEEPVNWTVYFSGKKYRVEQDLGRYRAISSIGDKWTFSIAEDGGKYELLEMDVNGKTSGSFELLEVPQLFRPQDFLLPRILESDGFRVIDCKRLPSSDGNLVKLDYQRNLGTTLSKESVLLDPDFAWAIRKHEMRMPNGEPLATEIKYSAGDELPKELQITLGGKLYRKVIYGEWISAALPQDPFNPAFYNLPEYSNTRLVVTYAISLGLCALTVLGFVWLWKNRTASL
jgi:hypothetical protein